ncbi:MAG: hypothetical protein AAF727_11435 [Pseudomonadota bacterium]
MGRLFGALGKRPAQDNTLVTPKRFSRFSGADCDRSAAPDAGKRFSRFSAQPTAEPQAEPSKKPVTPRRVTTAKDTTPALQTAISTADHLISDADIPVSILQRALPQRFAALKDDNHAPVLS